MAVNVERGGAKIYQFPLQPRRRLEEARPGPKTFYDIAPVSVVDQCWYHEEAIRSEASETEAPKPC